LLFLVVVLLEVDQMEVLNLVHQVVVEYKEEVEAPVHLVLEIHIQDQ
tara:strand:+ start:505 stop:645 length:141 start_codon:yes stop_codon:yes gene_type:complete